MPRLGSAALWGLLIGTPCALLIWYSMVSPIIEKVVSQSSTQANPLLGLLNVVTTLGAPVLFVAIGVVGARQSRPSTVGQSIAAGAVAGLASAIPLGLFVVSPWTALGMSMLPLVPATTLVEGAPLGREIVSRALGSVALDALWIPSFVTAVVALVVSALSGLFGLLYYLIATRFGKRSPVI